MGHSRSTGSSTIDDATRPVAEESQAGFRDWEVIDVGGAFGRYTVLEHIGRRGMGHVYLDDESTAMNGNLKDFARGMVRLAQAQELLKPIDPTVLMELVFGAFYGLIRAHHDGCVELSHALIADTEQACWDAVAVHDVPGG